MFINNLLKDYKEGIDKCLFLVAVLVFVLWSFVLLKNHIPYFDEVNAWNIASYLDLPEIFKIAKYEGHMFVWYTILIPFAKSSLFFPYSMQIINWLFAFIAILVMWRFAPFNSITKFFITFSFPIKLHVYFARCYSIGILLLFIIASMYYKRMKHPYIYSFLLILLANTSVMALTGAFALGILFLCDLFIAYKKSILTNENITISLLILLIGGGAVLAQLANFEVPFYAAGYKNSFFGFYFHNFSSLKYLLLPVIYSLLLLFSVKFMKKDLKSAFFLLMSQAFLMAIFLFAYGGREWHYSFLFVYFITAIWIYCEGHKDETFFQKAYMCIFTVFMFILIFVPTGYKNHNSNFIDFRDYIIENINIYSSKKIFVFPNSMHCSDIFPYLEKYKLNIYNSYANPLRSVDFYSNQYKGDDINFKAIEKELQNTDYAFIWTDSNDLILKQLKLFKQNKITIIPYSCVLPVFVYKISVKKGVE